MKITLLFTLLFLSACAITPLKETSYKRDYTPVGSKSFDYQDKALTLSYIPVTFGSGIPLTIENKTDKPIKIIWDETTFIDQNGTSEKIIHDGVKLIEKGAAMPATIIPPKAKVNEAITPVSRIYWSSGWNHINICGTTKYISYNNYEQSDDECLGKTFGFYITYELNGKKKAVTLKYTFTKKDLIVQPSITAKNP